MTPFLIIAGFIVVFAVIGYFGHAANVRRRESLRALADQLGFRFDPDADHGLWSRHQHFGLFTTGDSRQGTNAMTGAIKVGDLPVAVFMGDYRYTTESGSGKDRRRTTHRHSYLICRMPFPVRQTLSFRKEGVFDKIAGAIGFEDIDFESAEFSRKFFVRSSDKKFAYDLFDPRMMQWLLESDPPSIQVAADEMLISGSTWPAEHFRNRVEFVREFIARWPSHLVDRLQSTPPPLPTT
jgi:hypothetical protein